jgi:hypothetical protein
MLTVRWYSQIFGKEGSRYIAGRIRNTLPHRLQRRSGGIGVPKSCRPPSSPWGGDLPDADGPGFLGLDDRIREEIQGVMAGKLTTIPITRFSCCAIVNVATALLRGGGRDTVKVEILEVEAEVRVSRDNFHRETLDRAREVLAKSSRKRT